MSLIELRRRGQNDSGTWWSARGHVEFNALGIGRIGKLGLELGLTPRPAKLLIIPDTDKLNLYVIPVQHHPLAVHVLYKRSRCTVNLSPLFAYLSHSTVPGTREFHPLELSPDPVDLDGKVLPALVMPMKATEIQWKKSNNNSTGGALAEAIQQAAAART